MAGVSYEIRWFLGYRYLFSECFGAVLPVFVTSVLPDGILEQLALCHLGSNVMIQLGYIPYIST